ncbi:MAG TPA: metal ABC transporter substrate-binding protein [Polyangia bacterium]|jgi:zinc/manganese transport system substrate-binding protein|nr:metal ABC transporter substrate-binding protein [Polyangia bacterium]
MRRRRFSTVLFASILGWAALGARPRDAAAGKLRVVATVGDLGALAREVLGDAGDVVVLAKPTQDPHFVDARPNLVLELNRADALVSMGLDYEVGWLPVLVRGSRNARIQVGGPGSIVASTMVPVLEVPRERIDRSMGDIHPGGNPHFTMDPRNGARVAQGLAARFAALAPDATAKFQQNAAAFVQALGAREKQWEALLGGARGTPVVTYHKSFIYLTSWLGLTEVGSIEPKPGIPPNAAHVAELIGEMRARGVKVILQERWYPSSVAESIASQTGAKLVLIAGMTADNGRYADHIDEVVRAIAAVLPAKAGATASGNAR